MHVLLILPPAEHADRATAPAPPWELVMLLSWLRARTGHEPVLLDLRLTRDHTAALDEALPARKRPAVALVFARLYNWPAVCATFALLARTAPAVPRICAGPLATLCPETVLREADIDYVIAGDPEPVLRGLLDHLHAPNRLRTLPGLGLRGGPPPVPHWLPDLTDMPTPVWESIPWAAYEPASPEGLRALVRISRGHTGSPADRASGGAHEPFRLMPLERLAASLNRHAHLGVVENLFIDPPGVWTPPRLEAWCDALLAAQCGHPWAFQCLPRLFSPAEAARLHSTGCRRVELILPAHQPAELAHYGIEPDSRLLRRSLDALANASIGVLVRCWVGGPGKARRDATAWTRLIRRLGFPPSSLQPFPLALDAPLAADHTKTLPGVQEWLTSPIDAIPVAAWGGSDGRKKALATCQEARQRLARSTLRKVSRLWRRWRDESIIEAFETRAMAWTRGPSGPPPPPT